MTDPDAARAFLLGEVRGMDVLDFVTLVPGGNALHAAQVVRGPEGDLEVRVPGRPPFARKLSTRSCERLRERGFASEDASNPMLPWTRAAADPDEAVDQARRVIEEVFDEAPGYALDVSHGSHRAEHEAQQKLAEVREHLDKVLTELVEGEPEKDRDGDYLLPIDDVQVVVAPRAIPGGPVIVRVFAITNVGVTVAPELGLFLARLNFGLTFGRFALDAQNSAIWFDETVLGDQFRDEELKFTIRVVASTADEWDDRLKQMFGGLRYQEVLAQRAGADAPPTKPGQGLYL